MKIIFGSGNQGKINMVKDFFKENNVDIEVLSLKDIKFEGTIVEDGTTFEENSMIKAKAIKKYCNEQGIKEIVVTDDAGLCVDALNGAPGVYSARYAGDHAPQEVTLNKLLDEMKDVPKEKRTATFVCVLTAILPNEKIIVVKGETKGKIATKLGPMGNLTYQPIFMPDGFGGRVMNELTPKELGATHREKALKELLKEII